MQYAPAPFRPVCAIFDPFAQHSNLILREADFRSRHHFGVGPPTLHGTDKQAAVGIAWQNVLTPSCAAPKCGGSAGQVKCRWRQTAIVAFQAVLLQHWLNLRKEVVLTRAFACRQERACGDEEQDGNAPQDHAARLTTSWQHDYSAFAQICADA